MKVGIVGAGPGGLVAARILSRAGVDVTVFEREPSFDDRAQGGSLDIHAESGQLAVSKAGLMEAFREIARYEDQEMHVYDRSGALRYSDRNTMEKDRPETNRGHLRSMLLNSLHNEIVRWGSRVSGVTQVGCGWNVDFPTPHPSASTS